MFLDAGFIRGAISNDPPPESYRQNYDLVLDWVFQGGWIIPEHEDLALSIWLGQTDPLNYQPVVKQAVAPAAIEPAAQPTKRASDQEQPKAASGATKSPFKRFGR